MSRYGKQVNCNFRFLVTLRPLETFYEATNTAVVKLKWYQTSFHNDFHKYSLWVHTWILWVVFDYSNNDFRVDEVKLLMPYIIMTFEWILNYLIVMKISQGLINNQLWDSPLWMDPLPEKFFYGSLCEGRQAKWQGMELTDSLKMPIRQAAI